MAEKIIKGDTFIRDGNTNAESLTVNNDKSTSGIAGSIATVEKDSDSDATDVAVFFDVSKINTVDQLSAEVYALVSRVVNSVNFNGKGLVGANLVGRNTGNGDFEYINGAFSTASNQGGGNVDFLIANNVKSSVTGSDTCTIDIMRADSGDVEINNVNATVNNAQGAHPSVQMTNGTIGNVVGIYVDLDYDNTGSVTVTGDIAYIRSGNDNLPTVGGNIYFIKSDSPYPSEFAGSIKANEFIKNGATSDDILLGDGTTTSLSGVSGLPSGFYEEGTFTPTLIDEGGGATYTATVGYAKYVRNGNSVTVQIKFSPISTTGTPSGNLRIGNLPYSGINLSFLHAESTGGDISFSSIKGQIQLNTNHVNLRYKNTGNTGLSSVYNSVTFSSGALFVSGTYITDDYTP